MDRLQALGDVQAAVSRGHVCKRHMHMDEKCMRCTAAIAAPALQAAGPALEGHDSLLVLLQQDLVRAMFAAARNPSLPCLAGICQVWNGG